MARSTSIDPSCSSWLAGHRCAGRLPLPGPEVSLRRVPVPPEVITLAVRWYLRFDLSSVTWKNSSPNAVSRSIT